MLRPIKFVSLNKILGWKKIRVQRVSQKNWKSREILQHMTLFEWLTFNSSVKWLTINQNPVVENFNFVQFQLNKVLFSMQSTTNPKKRKKIAEEKN